MLKNIRKKDGITLFITEPEKPSDPLKLGICVENDENNKVVTYIRITPTQLTTIDKPEEYENPIIMTSKEFQKMKTLHNLSQIMTVSYKPQYINFFCDAGELYSRSVSIGNNSSEEDIKNEKQYKQEYYTSYVTSLTKCAGQSGVVQIFVHENNGMKIKMKAGGLGDVIVYIKSKEIIEDENLDENLVVIGKESNSVKEDLTEYIERDDEDEKIPSKIIRKQITIEDDNDSDSDDNSSSRVKTVSKLKSRK